MTRLLIVYGTEEGQTAKIATRIGEVARGKGYSVDVYNAKNAPRSLSFDDVAAVVVGASLHAGRYEGYLRNWVKAHRADLERVPSFFYSVSLTSSLSTPESQAQVERCVDQFVRETGWKPPTVAYLAGALPYTRYNVVKRFVMRMIAKSVGGPTDTSRDYEFTDWDAVTHFAEEVLAAMPTSAPRGVLLC